MEYELQKQKQIPCGNDRQKSKGKSKCNYNGNDWWAFVGPTLSAQNAVRVGHPDWWWLMGRLGEAGLAEAEE